MFSKWLSLCCLSDKSSSYYWDVSILRPLNYVFQKENSTVFLTPVQTDKPIFSRIIDIISLKQVSSNTSHILLNILQGLDFSVTNKIWFAVILNSMKTNIFPAIQNENKYFSEIKINFVVKWFQRKQSLYTWKKF